MPSRRRAFTLVELLVVVGIVAMLIALLMPALARARTHAREVHCGANLRSVGQAMTMYVQNYRYYPGDCVWYQISISDAGRVTESNYGTDPACDSAASRE